MKYLSILLLLICSFNTVKAQTNQTNSSCVCLDVFNRAVSKIESNYAAYHLEIRGKRDAEYRRFVKEMKQKARRASTVDCIFVLQDFVRFFRDGHLFVQEDPKLTDEDVSRLTEAAEQTGRTETEIRRYLDANKNRLDPIEGIWYNSEGHRFGIVRDNKPGRRDFAAILLSEKVERWKVGQVKAEFKKLPDGSYSNIFYSGRHFPLHLEIYERGRRGGAILRRNGLLLHIAPITWGKYIL